MGQGELALLAEHGQHRQVVGLAAGGLDGPRGQAVGRDAEVGPAGFPAGAGDQPERHLPRGLGPLTGVGPAAWRQRLQRRPLDQPVEGLERRGDLLRVARSQGLQGDRDRDREILGMRLAELLQRLVERGELLGSQAASDSAIRLRNRALSSSRG